MASILKGRADKNSNYRRNLDLREDLKLKW